MVTSPARGRMQIDTTRRPNDPVRRSNYFKSATRFTKMERTQRDALLAQIREPEVKRHFVSITDLILDGKTQYQQIYNIDGISKWESL